MAIWPFNRKKRGDSDLPKEVQDYYQAEKRERVGVAGLLAAATLLITVLVAMGLFFGGRWLYRTAFNNDDNTNDQQIAQQDNQDQSENTESGDQNDNQDQETSQPPQQDQPEDQPAEPAPADDQPTQEPDNDSDDTDDRQRASIPLTGDSEDLPNTGPADTAAIVIASALTAGGVYYVTRRPREEA